MRLGRVAIVGAGQVGTMLGLALREGGADVTLADRDARVAAASLARGAGDRVTDPAEAPAADTVVLAIPVPEILAFLELSALELRPGTLLLDTGSVKAPVVEAMRRRVPAAVAAVGGHPLAGTERPGPEGADRERLRGATFALCPVRDDPEALERAALLVRAMGAEPVVIDAEEHDRTMARTSHLPHIVAAALALVARGCDPRLAASGLAGATRLAASDPDMVAGFLWANAAQVREATAELHAALDALVEAAARGPESPVAILEEARAAATGSAG